MSQIPSRPIPLDLWQRKPAHSSPASPSTSSSARRPLAGLMQSRARVRIINSTASLRKGETMATIDSRRAADFDLMAPEVHRGLPARFGLGPGLVAGLVMLIILVILSLAQGQGFW